MPRINNAWVGNRSWWTKTRLLSSKAQQNAQKVHQKCFRSMGDHLDESTKVDMRQLSSQVSRSIITTNDTHREEQKATVMATKTPNNKQHKSQVVRRWTFIWTPNSTVSQTGGGIPLLSPKIFESRHPIFFEHQHLLYGGRCSKI